MERKWIEKFYTECGREVSLAYNVLNQTNNWAITLAAATITSAFIGASDFNSGKLELHYPNIYYWLFIIIAWIIMIRFFVRSALGLANMYRWNELIYASSRILSLHEGHPGLPVYERNFAKKVDAYFYRWKIPISRSKLIWNNLKLMYLWLFLIIICLFIWGLLILERDYLYWFGIVIFLGSTITEAIIFKRYYGLQYEKLDLEQEPHISKIWCEEEIGSEVKEPRLIILGFCDDGPFREAVSLLGNSQVSWLPWNYHAGSIDAGIIKDLSGGLSLKDREIAFARWPSGTTGKRPIIRYGRIDYYSFTGGILRLTIFLEPRVESSKQADIIVNDTKILCFYS